MYHLKSKANFIFLFINLLNYRDICLSWEQAWKVNLEYFPNKIIIVNYSITSQLQWMKLIVFSAPDYSFNLRAVSRGPDGLA